MMYANADSIVASALTRRQSGLTGNYCAPCGMAGPLGTDVGAIAAKGGADYLTSGGDIDKLYDPIFDILDRLTYSLPSPFDLFAKFGLGFAKQGPDATRNALKTAARAMARYTRVDVSKKALAHMAQSAPITFFNWAARDKMAQNAGNSPLFKAALNVYNSNASADNKLNLDVRTRLANNVEWLLIKSGATPQEAATVGWTIAKNMEADPGTLASFAKKAGAQNAEEMANPEIAWNRLHAGKLGGKAPGGGDDADEGTGAEGGGGGAALPLLALGAIAALFSMK